MDMNKTLRQQLAEISDQQVTVIGDKSKINVVGTLLYTDSDWSRFYVYTGCGDFHSGIGLIHSVQGNLIVMKSQH